MSRWVNLVLAVWVTVQASAYCYTGNQTASGTWPKQGRTIAASRHLPIGARVYIPSRGWYRVEDRMNRRYDKRKIPTIDIYMDSYDQAIDWGRQDIRVKVIKPKEVKK